MKVRGYLKGSGKLGNIVCSTVAGETIARDYNPEVANPNTETQVAQRAKFKLMSQLSSVMAPVIAIPRIKSQSSRNLFVKKNMPAAIFDDVEASINLNRVQLTDSNLGLETVGCDRSSGTKCVCGLYGNKPLGIKGAVYCIFTKDDAGNLSLHDSAVVTENDPNDGWRAELNYTAAEIVVYGYALIGSEEAMSAAFGNMQAITAEQVAKVITSTGSKGDALRPTKTKGFTMPVGVDDGESDDDDGKVRLSITITGQGSATGAGRYEPNSTVTCVATPASGMEFKGWFRGGSLVSSSTSYQLTIVADTTIEARFAAPAPRHTVSASVNPNGSGSVSGTGSYEEGSNCTVVATAAAGYQFKAWQRNGEQVSVSASYTFVVMGDVALVAVFEEIQAGFDNVTVNGQPFTANLQDQTQATVAGNYQGVATHVVEFNGATAYQPGDTFTPSESDVNQRSAQISNGSFTIAQFAVAKESGYQLFACTVNGKNWTIETVFPYKIYGMYY